MELTHYIDTVRSGVTDAAALADDHTREVAGRLGSAVASATRLALIAALTDASAEISTELAPGSVEVRMNGTEPTFVVTLPHPGDDQPTVLMPEADEDDEDETVTVDEDEPQARISLRLPQSVKAKVDEYADAEGVSTNTWLLHRVLEALADRTGAKRRGFSFEASGRDGGAFRFGPVPPMPPMPPMPPFPPGFGPRGGREAAADRRAERAARRQRPDRGSGSVQGWVR